MNDEITQEEFENFFKTKPKEKQIEKLGENNMSKTTENNSNNELPMELLIEKGIAIPPSSRVVTNPFRLISKSMEVGDSILVDKSPSNLPNIAKALNFKFTSRKIDDKIRIWRIA